VGAGLPEAERFGGRRARPGGI